VTATTESVRNSAKRGTFWALVPVGLLLACLVGLLTMASIARDDPGFALEPSYYERAVRWERQQQERAENARLGYRIGVETLATERGVELRATLRDRSGAALTGSVVQVDAFANARAADRRKLTLREAPDGTYRAVLGAARPGLWEFRFDVVRGREHFTEVVRADLPGGSSQ
jgi:nitrogen fixation protein FixH